MTFYKGDIVLPIQSTQNPKKLRHPAVIWDHQISGSDDFTGIMLTRASNNRFPDNIAMKSEHFSEGFYNRTHFVNQRFIKFSHWGPFKKIGCLTSEGIAYIEEKLSENGPLPFDDYLESN